MVDGIAEVIQLTPAQPVPPQFAPAWPRRASVALMDVVTSPIRLLPRQSVDEWGRDGRLVDALAPLAQLGRVSVIGDEHIGPGGALVVVNTRPFGLTPITAAWTLGEVLGRPVRFVGRPDIVPFGPLLRRVGGLLARTDEIAGALRDGQVVVLGTATSNSPRRAGTVDVSLLGAAVRAKVPVHVAATSGAFIGRPGRLEISPPLRLVPKRRGPLTEVELAELAHRRLQELLDQAGEPR